MPSAASTRRRVCAITIFTDQSERGSFDDPSIVRDFLTRQLESQGVAVESVRVLSDTSAGFVRHPLSVDAGLAVLLSQIQRLIEVLYPELRSPVRHEALVPICQRLAAAAEFVAGERMAPLLEPADPDPAADLADQIGRVAKSCEKLVASVKDGSVRTPSI